jgi:hypothetical protein
MKKLPYISCFIVVQINNQIKKFYFDEVIDYKDYSNPDFEEHKQYMCRLALVDDKSANDLFVLMCQAYLNSKAVLKEFKSIAKESCNQSSDLCVTLVVDIHTKKDGGATIQICTLANDEKRDAFNYLAQFISDNNMKFFMSNLTTEQQDLLFDIA